IEREVEHPREQRQRAIGHDRRVALASNALDELPDITTLDIAEQTPAQGRQQILLDDAFLFRPPPMAFLSDLEVVLRQVLEAKPFTLNLLLFSRIGPARDIAKHQPRLATRLGEGKIRIRPERQSAKPTDHAVPHDERPLAAVRDAHAK